MVNQEISRKRNIRPKQAIGIIKVNVSITAKATPKMITLIPTTPLIIEIPAFFLTRNIFVNPANKHKKTIQELSAVNKFQNVGAKPSPRSFL